VAKRGWEEGRNIQIDYRFAAAGNIGTGQYQALAKQLIALQPDVILTQTPVVTAALQQHENRSIPTVFVNVSDPIGMGFKASLARAGGNITGMLHYEGTIVGKWLGMLKEIAPWERRQPRRGQEPCAGVKGRRTTSAVRSVTYYEPSR
jgi:putative tryptophan/tyrosine transport system substrate-binding protein